MPRSSLRAASTLLVGRCVVEGITFGTALAVIHAVSGGRGALPLFAATLGMIGASLLLVALVRELASERRGGAIVGATLLVGAALAFVLPSRGLDGAGTIARVIAFAILAEVFLWRIVSLGRVSVRWVDARNAAPLAGVAIAVAAIAPGPIDRAPLAPLALVVVASAGLSLSLARAAEELSLLREGEQRGAARVSSVTSVAVLFGVVAVIAAFLSPTLERLISDAGGWVAPALGTALFYLLLPLGYLAAYLVDVLAALLRNVNLSLGVQPLFQRRSPEEEELLLREVERNRPWVLGGVEILVALVVAAVALVLLERLVRERRVSLPSGVELERGSTDGVSLRATLGSLLPRRGRGRHGPREDGSASAALRVLYWRFLTLAERIGPGWRDAAETPDEHARRLVQADARWTQGTPIVSAFDALRYGEVAPDQETLARARSALRSLEANLRT